MPSRGNVRRFMRYLSASDAAVDEVAIEALQVIFKNQKLNTSVPRTFTDADLQGVTCPTLFLVGEYEVIYNPHKALARAKNTLPNVQTRLIPNASHALASEQPDLVNQCIIDFLQHER
jgi:pimeloyl-ACP methyl ester carboxylesterase